MKRLLVLMGVLVVLSCESAWAGSCMVEGVYDVQFDKALNGRLDPGYTTTQIEFSKDEKDPSRFTGVYVKPYRRHIYTGECHTLQKSVITMVYHDQGNGYYSSYALKETGKDTYQGAWTDVRGNIGDFVMTKSPAGPGPVSTYMRLDKAVYSSVKDGVLKVHFRDLPGFHAQKICLIHPDGRAIRCTSFETSAKTKGNVDFYVPQPPGEYHLVVHYHDDKVTDQEERNRQLDLVRDKLIFNAVK